MRHFVRLSWLLPLALALAVLDTSAYAGTYTVNATCGAWQAVNNASHGLAIYPACPTLVVRNVVGNSTTPETANAAWIFEAPPGTSLQSAILGGSMIGVKGWQATIYPLGGPTSGTALENCPSPSCPGGTRSFSWQTYGAGSSDAIIARVRCGRAGGCPNNAQSGGIHLWTSVITVADSSPPSVGANGPLVTPGWKGGTVALAAVASDNVGVKQTRALIDGVPKTALGHTCNYAIKVPCPNGTDTLTVPLGGLPDGQHTLSVQATDSADNLGGIDRTILVDNTPPVAPGGPSLSGGSGWRAENRWTVGWKNPPQQFAPIAAAVYQLCPAAADSDVPSVASKARTQCVTRSWSQLAVERIDNVSLPDPGEWTMRLWLVDSAGNRNPESAVKLTGLGFDPTPPTQMGFAGQDPNDPARVQVRAIDPTSGIASGSVEVRRRGADTWRPLPTEVVPGGLSAFVNDEVLRRGVYRLRAVAINRAGLQQGTAVRENGRLAKLRLPVRTRARLVAGRFVRRCRGDRCTRKAVRRVRGHLGRPTRLQGRLRSAGNPLPRQDIEVWRRVRVIGATWTRIGTTPTGRSGRFKYKVPAGPASRIRFRFPGGPQIRGKNATVRLVVPAKTSMDVSRRDVVNGEYVMFAGRVQRKWIPPEGALVELQVFTRRRWRTFAQPRADAGTGNWQYQYRFETIRGDVSFRFRARIRRQSNYPFDTGHSRLVRVRVRGL